MKATIVEITSETNDISSFKLQPENEIKYIPGQWIYVRVSPELKHHFTLSSSPTEKHLMITTKNTGSDYKTVLWQKKVGDELEINGAFGSFLLDEKDITPRIFIAGGIGVTPYRSMLTYIQDSSLNIPYTLLYSVKSADDVCFRSQLVDNPQVKIVNTTSEGRLDEAKIKNLCPDWEKSSIWLCGPPAMVEAFVEIANKLGLPPERIRSEEFTGYEA